MSTANATVMDRLVDLVPKSYRQEVTRMVRRVRERLPLGAIEHRLDALERQMEHRFSDLETKLEEVLRRLSKAA